MDDNEIEMDDSPLMTLSDISDANEPSQLLRVSDNYEIEIDDSTFQMLSAIANAKDDPQSLVELADIDPNEFREFLSKCGETENEDALELLRAAEQKHFSKAHVVATRKRSYPATTTLYVGNLAFQTTSEELQELFAQAGTVESASVVEDRDTGRSRGFAFVEMSTKEEVAAVIEQFNGKEVGGRALKVNEAKPRENRRGGGSGRERGSLA